MAAIADAESVVLLIEDNQLDQELVDRAIGRDHPNLRLEKLGDGESALRYLFTAASDTSASGVPDLVLLDLNLPNLDGREVLAHLREHDRFAALPVVVLSTSRSEADVCLSYRLGCNSYVVKPDDPDEFITTIRTLRDYWLGVVTLPSS